MKDGGLNILVPDEMQEQEIDDEADYYLVRVHENIDGTIEYSQIDYTINLVLFKRFPLELFENRLEREKYYYDNCCGDQDFIAQAAVVVAFPD